MFLCKKSDLNFFKPDKKKFFQTSFTNLKEKFNILIDIAGGPEGGSWTYDTMNREKYPTNKKPPEIMSVNDKSELLSETYDYINNIYTKNYGNLESEFFILPTLSNQKNGLMTF